MADQWGIVAPAFVALTQTLTAKISTASGKLQRVTFPQAPSDAEPSLVSAVQHTHEVNVASKDLRSALSAYSHRVHEPRPRVSSISEAQGTTTQGLLRRYNATVERAIRELVAGTVTAETLRVAFASLTEDEAAAIAGARATPITGFEGMVLPPSPKAARTKADAEL